MNDDEAKKRGRPSGTRNGATTEAVFDLIDRGLGRLSNAEMARVLGVSTTAVAYHLDKLKKDKDIVALENGKLAVTLSGLESRARN